MSLIKKAGGLLLGLVLVLALVLAVVPAPLCKGWLAYQATQWLGARVEIKSAEFSWWPTQLVLEHIAITNPLKPTHNALSLARVQADIDVLASLQGTLHIPLLQVSDVQVAGARVTSGAVPGMMPRRFFVTQDGAGFRLPVFDMPPPDAIVAAENSRYQQHVDIISQLLQEKLASWETQLPALPDETALAGYRQEWASLAKDKSLDAAARVQAQQALKGTLQSDFERLRIAHQEMRSQWQIVQTQYAELRQLPVVSIAAELQKMGVSESVLSRLGQALLQEKVQEWLNTALAVHQLLLAPVMSDNAEAEGLSRQPRVLIKKTVVSGAYSSGEQPVSGESTDNISGEILNLTDAPHALAEPTTLHLQAGGVSSGSVQLSAMLDHRVAGKDIDRFNFSLKSLPLHAFALAQNDALRVVANVGTVSIDLAGSIEQRQRLDVNLSSEFAALALEVTAEKTDNGAAAVVADRLRATSAMTVTASASGELNKPVLQMTCSLDEVLATAVREALATRLAAWVEPLQQGLETALDTRLSGMQGDLSRGSALLAEIEKRMQSFERLHGSWAP